jgi:hypothetical protein
VVDDMTARAVRGAWQQAEQGLYSMGSGDVARYELAIRLVRAVADELGAVGSTADLLDAWPRAEELVHAAADRAGLSTMSLRVDQVAGAAFALRQATLQAQEARQLRIERVAAARAEGADWVVLHEGGNLSAGLADPYGSTRMHVASGLAVVSGIYPDPATGGPVRTLTVVGLDPRTGDLVDDDPGVADLECLDERTFLSAEHDLRGLVERRSSEHVG